MSRKVVKIQMKSSIFQNTVFLKESMIRYMRAIYFQNIQGKK